MLWSCSSLTTTYRVSHKISAAYAQGWVSCFDAFSAMVPPVLRKLSAGFCTGESDEFPHNLRIFSTGSAQDFDAGFACGLRQVFPQRFRTISATNSRRGRREKWRKESGGRKCVEKRSRLHTVCGTWNNLKGICQYSALAPPPPNPPPPPSNPPPVACSGGALGLAWIAPAICITSS